MEPSLWIGRVRTLTLALMFSGAINIGLITAFIYVSIEDPVGPLLHTSHSPPPPPPMTNTAVLQAYALAPFEELLLHLEEAELVEEGFTKRDLALACLVSFHHFNLERALGGTLVQQRKMAFSHSEEIVDLTLFPGLLEEQYRAIIKYAKTEKWPFTSEGIYYELKRSPVPPDPTLVEAFLLTPEFYALDNLFIHSGLPVEKPFLVKLAIEGDWAMLAQLDAQQKLTQDVSPQRRRALLLEYLQRRSKMAARILGEIDAEFTSKRLSDAQITLVLDLLPKGSPPAILFAKALLAGPRSDAVRKKAASFLGIAFDEKVEKIAAAPKLGPMSHPPSLRSPAAPAAAPTKKRTYIVQQGDSLWKIARRHKVSVEEIMQLNRLEAERLQPGMQLQIPSSR